MKKFITFICIAALSLLSAGNVLAAEIRLRESYIEDTGDYRYYLDERNYVTSSQQLGRIVENVIKFTYNDYTYVSLTKDGENCEIVSGGYIYGDGNYTLTIGNGKDSGSINFIMRQPSGELSEDENFYNKSVLTQAYSAEQGLYSFSLGGLYTFYSPIPNYAVTDKPVKLLTPADDRMDITAYKDGEEINYSSGKTFSEPGYYMLSLVYDSADIDDERYTEGELQGFSEQAMDNADIVVDDSYFNIADIAIYSFVIIGGPQNKLGFINPPQDYTISSVVLDGQKQPVSTKFFKPVNDGNYRILFKNSSGILPDYTLNFTRDTAAPTLRFGNVGLGGIAINKFSIIKDSDNTVVEVFRSGVPYENTAEITESGLYRITATDSAGNTSAYIISLKKKYTAAYLLLIPLAIAVVVGIKLYSAYIGKNIHIR